MDLISQAQGVATSSVSHVWELFGNSLAFIILAGLLFLFALRAGRGAFLSFIVALYAGYALYAVFPYTDTAIAMGTTPLLAFLITFALYAVAVLIPYVLIRRVATSDFISIGFIGLLILSFITAGFLFALGYHAFDAGSIYTLPPLLETLFVTKEYFFGWFFAPLVALFFLAR